MLRFYLDHWWETDNLLDYRPLTVPGSHLDHAVPLVQRKIEKLCGSALTISRAPDFTGPKTKVIRIDRRDRNCETLELFYLSSRNLHFVG
jgi:hypothetical protein